MIFVYSYYILWYAVRVWNIEMDFDHPEKTALAGINATEEYFRSLGMPVSLQEVDGVTTYSMGTEPNRRVIVAYEKK